MPKSSKRIPRNNSNSRREPRPTPGAGCVLFRSPPPFEHYTEWFPVAEIAERAERRSGELDPDDRAALHTLLTLGPLYDGMVPVAALDLHDQLRTGAVRVAVPGRPGRYTELPVADLASLAPAPSTDLTQALHVHAMHADWLFVLDDTNLINITPNGRPNEFAASDPTQRPVPRLSSGRPKV